MAEKRRDAETTFIVWFCSVVFLPFAPLILGVYYGIPFLSTCGKGVRRAAHGTVSLLAEDEREVRAGRRSGLWRVYAALIVGIFFVLALIAGLLRDNGHESAARALTDVTSVIIVLLIVGAVPLRWVGTPLLRAWSHHREERRRRRECASRERTEREARERVEREAMEQAERERLARIEQERAERQRRELEESRRRQEELRRADAERDRLDREEAERARKERPAAREAALLFYAQHATRIGSHFSMRQLQDYLRDRIGDDLPYRQVLAAGEELRGSLERIVVREEMRHVFRECAEAIDDRFSEEMLELYLGDAMGDHRPIEDVREAAKRLRQILLQLYEDSPLKVERERREAERGRRTQEEAEIERMRAMGMTDELIELELAERRVRANGSR